MSDNICCHLDLGYDFVIMSAIISVVGQVTTSTSLCRNSSAIQETLIRCVLGMWASAGLVPFFAMISQALLSSKTRPLITSSLKMLRNNERAGRIKDFRQAIRLIVSASGVDVLTHDCLRHVHARGMWDPRLLVNARYPPDVDRDVRLSPAKSESAQLSSLKSDTESCRWTRAVRT
jgi:hypothetical protein